MDEQLAGGGSGGGARLRIINGCQKDALWIANFAFQTPYFPQDLKLAAGASHNLDDAVATFTLTLSLSLS